MQLLNVALVIHNAILLLGLAKESPRFEMGTSLFSSRKSPSDVFCACARLKKVSGAHDLFTLQ